MHVYFLTQPLMILQVLMESSVCLLSFNINLTFNMKVLEYFATGSAALKV